METEQETTMEENADIPSAGRDTAFILIHPEPSRGSVAEGCCVRNEVTPEPLAEVMAKLIARDAEVVHLSQQLVEKDGVIERLNASLDAAVGAYRTTTIALHRDLPQELIEGDSVSAVDESLKRATALVARVKSTMAAAAPPLVAAGRSRSSDTLSTVDKIRVGLGG